MVKFAEVPRQLRTGLPPVYTGVTEIVAVIGVLPLLTAGKLLILPVPLAARPMAGLLFVQLKDVEFVPVKFTAVIFPPLHITWFPGGFVSVGTGLTVRIAELVKLPAHPPFENFARNP
jgi:hypothetical protein